MKRYDILCLPPQDKPVYFIVEAMQPDDLETTEYRYEEGSCPKDFFHKLEAIVNDGDDDPHGIFDYLGTTDDWRKRLSEIDTTYHPDE